MRKLRSDAKLTRDQARVALHLIEDEDATEREVADWLGVSSAVISLIASGANYGVAPKRGARNSHRKAIAVKLNNGLTSYLQHCDPPLTPCCSYDNIQEKLSVELKFELRGVCH